MIGLLLDAFLVRQLLVPALIVVVGPCSGWPAGSSASARSALNTDSAHRSMHHQKMTTLPADLLTGDPDARGHRILDTLVDAFSNLMAASPAAFQAEFRKIVADPFALPPGNGG